MTDTDTRSAPSVNSTSAPVRSRRGRWMLVLVLAVLIALIGLSSYLLYREITPRTRTTIAGGRREPSTGGVTWVRSIYGTSNTPEGQFGRTNAGVPDADGNIWVTEANQRTLLRFTPDGRYLGAVGSAEPSAPLVAPSRLAIGPDGLIYVCETTQDLVRVLRPDGTDAGSFQVPQVVSVAVNKDRIAVGSVYGFALLDKSGKPVEVLGSRGKGEDQFDYVHGIAFDANGNVYVADSYNNRLSAYDRAGRRLWIIRTGAPANSAEMVQDKLSPRETTDTALTGADALQLPMGLTIDRAGRIVVADMFDCTLAVFDAKSGKFIAKYGDGGAEDGQFFYPVSVSYDPVRDWFVVADSMNRRIEIVRIPGSSGGGGVGTLGRSMVTAVNRTLAGPLRALLLPALLLLALLIAIIVGVVVRAVRKRNAAQEAGAEARAGAAPDADGHQAPTAAVDVDDSE